MRRGRRSWPRRGRGRRSAAWSGRADRRLRSPCPGHGQRQGADRGGLVDDHEDGAPCLACGLPKTSRSRGSLLGRRLSKAFLTAGVTAVAWCSPLPTSRPRKRAMLLMSITRTLRSYSADPATALIDTSTLPSELVTPPPGPCTRKGEVVIPTPKAGSPVAGLRKRGALRRFGCCFCGRPHHGWGRQCRSCGCAGRDGNRCCPVAALPLAGPDRARPLRRVRVRMGLTVRGAGIEVRPLRRDVL